MKIALNKNAFLETLFNPAGTADGYVTKKTKNTVSVWLAGKDYVVNKHKCWLTYSVVNGRKWFQHAVIDEHLNRYAGYGKQNAAAAALLEHGECCV